MGPAAGTSRWHVDDWIHDLHHRGGYSHCQGRPEGYGQGGMAPPARRWRDGLLHGRLNEAEPPAHRATPCPARGRVSHEVWRGSCDTRFPPRHQAGGEGAAAHRPPEACTRATDACGQYAEVRGAQGAHAWPERLRRPARVRLRPLTLPPATASLGSTVGPPVVERWPRLGAMTSDRC